MEWTLKALLTAAAVLAAICAGRRCERAIGGAVAGLPLVTAPWLVGVAARDGAGPAAGAAIASVAACVVLAAFATAYAHAARRTGVVGATVAALGGAAFAVPLAGLASVRLDVAVGAALLGCTLAWLTWPRTVARCVARRPGIELPLVAASAGIVGASSGSVAAWLGGFGASVFTALPVVGFATVVTEHRTGGAGAAAQCLHGYLAGLYGKVAFGLVFAVAIVHWGVAAAIVAATAAGGLTTFVIVRHVAACADRPAGYRAAVRAVAIPRRRRLPAEIRAMAVE